MANICHFCLKLSNDCGSVDDILKARIELIFINELAIADNFLICKECIERVHSASDLKSASLCNENLIVSYETNKPRPAGFIDFYLERNKIKCDFPNEMKICRFCITEVPDNNFYLLKNTEDNMNLKEIITTHLPEVDLTITENTIVCKTCLRKLQEYGMFINSCLHIHNKKKYYLCNNSDISDSNYSRKFKLETNICPQDFDNSDIHSTNIKNELFIEEFENGGKKHEETIEYSVDNIQLKDDIEIDELKYSTGGEQITTESISYDVQLSNNALSKDDDFEIEETPLQIVPKVESDVYVLKEEEISLNDGLDDDDSIDFQAYSERNLDTQLFCNNNRGISQHKSNECSTPSIHKVPREIRKNSKFGSSFFRESFPKMEQKCPSSTKKSIEQLMGPRNSGYQVIKMKNGFRCGHCSYQNHLEAQVEVHFKNYHYSKYDSFNPNGIVHEKNSVKFEKQSEVELAKCSYYDYKSNHNYLQLYLKKRSNEFSLYNCAHCDFKTKYKSCLKSHLIVHSESKCYKCELCDFKTKYISNLRRHLIGHPDENNFHKCGQCDYKTKYKHCLNSHLIVHSVEGKCYKCELCDYKTYNKHNFKRHSIVHSDKSNGYQCEHCDFKTKCKRSLKRHLLRHSGESNSYKCAQCDFKTKDKYYFKMHLIVHSDERRSYKCELCDYKTIYKHDLKKHLIVHSDKSIFYKCEYCDYKTKHKSIAKRHLIVHSSDFYKCEHCDFKTKYKSNLKQHLLLNSDGSNSYKCVLCDFETEHKSGLNKHLIMHADEHNFYKCVHCDFKTKHKGNLKRHLNVHSDEHNFYKCERCDFKTKYKYNLKKHFVSHLGGIQRYKC